MQWFSHILDVFTPKTRQKFLVLTFLWIKTNIAYEVIAKQHIALQVEFIAGVKLICYVVLYYCFLNWAHLPNMVVGDLDIYYTLYLGAWFLISVALFTKAYLRTVGYVECYNLSDDGMCTWLAKNHPRWRKMIVAISW